MAAGIDGRKYSGAKCYVSARTLEEEAEEEGGRRKEEEGGRRKEEGGGVRSRYVCHEHRVSLPSRPKQIRIPGGW